jgi:hypothetical protein
MIRLESKRFVTLKSGTKSIIHINKVGYKIIALLITLSLTGCVSVQPQCIDDVCSIFNEYPNWYWATQASEEKWGAPVPVQMAIMHQESSFIGNAKPPRQRCLGFIPWTRPTSAYGYSQAVDSTWRKYQQSSGNSYGSRKNFKDAADFVGWYIHTAHCQLGIAPSNAYALYLAYHEGLGGYARKSYRSKPWLIKVAKKVSLRSSIYQSQLNECRDCLPKRHWWN